MIGATMAKGRKRKPNVARTKSGRISRSADAYQEHIGPIQVRMRMHNLTEPQARDQKAESVIGRLSFIGQPMGGISPQQYEALVEYRAQVDMYRRAIDAVDALRTASARTMTPDEEQHRKWCDAVIGKWEASRKAIMQAQVEPSNRMLNLMGALGAVVIENQNLPYLFDALRVAANALVRHYRMGVK